MAERIMKEIYYRKSNPSGYGGIYDLFHAVRKKKPNVTINQIKKFLAKQDTYTLNRPVITRFKKRKRRDLYFSTKE